MMPMQSPNFITSPRRPTPVTRFCSIFNQLLQLFPRTEFQSAVQTTKAERHARGFACWDQFVAMLFCQLGRAHSLREICGGLASCEGKLTHLTSSRGCRPRRRGNGEWSRGQWPLALSAWLAPDDPSVIIPVNDGRTVSGARHSGPGRVTD